VYHDVLISLKISLGDISGTSGKELLDGYCVHKMLPQIYTFAPPTQEEESVGRPHWRDVFPIGLAY
jgi:hypothetical protein